MAPRVEPTMVLDRWLDTEDEAGRPCHDAVVEAGQLRDLMVRKQIVVIEDEQRGDDPVTGQEVLNNSKLERWRDLERDGRLPLGQITLGCYTETGSHVEVSGGKLRVYGVLTIIDGRQRAYTIRDVVTMSREAALAEEMVDGGDEEVEE